MRNFSRPMYVSAAVLGLTVTAQANPYASAVTETGGTVSFTLNEDGGSVTVFRNGVPSSLGVLPKGVNSFPRSGAATYSIQVTKAAPNGFTVISTAARETNFELPRGVAVNGNAGAGGAPNPLFGRVYVSNGRATATAAGRPMNDGVYLLNGDLSSAVGQGDTARTGGIPVIPDSTTAVDPFRLAVGPDDRLYVSHYSDVNAGLFDTDPDVTSFNHTFDNTGRNSVGLNATSGSISDVVVVGTGANRRIFTTDEDLDAGRKGIYRYDIGTAAQFVGAPSANVFNPGSSIINSLESLAIDKRGQYWISQNRAGGGTDKTPSLQLVAEDGSVVFSSLSLASDGSSLTDPLRGTQGIAYDPVNDVVALVSNRTVTGTGTGLVTIFDAAARQVLTTFAFATTGAATNTDAAFDAAGNLYVTNRSAERLVVWSPGGGTVATTFSDGTFAISPIPEPAVGSLLGAGLIGLLARRRRSSPVI